MLHVCFSEIFQQGVRTLILQVRKLRQGPVIATSTVQVQVPGLEMDQSAHHDLSESPGHFPLSTQPQLLLFHGPSLTNPAEPQLASCLGVSAPLSSYVHPGAG